MALTLVGTSSNGGNAQNPTCTIPTGTTTGDLMVCQWSTGAAVHTSPTGWTDELQTGTSSMITYYIWKIADSGDTPGASRTFSQGGTTPTRLAITTYRGDFDTTNPIDVTGFISTGASASITSPATTTPAAGWVVESAGVRGGSSYTSSPPAGYVEIYDTTTSSGTPAKAATAMYDGASGTLDLLGSGVSIGGHTFTASASVAAGEQHAHTVFIRQLNAGPKTGTATGTFTWTGTIGYTGPLDPAVHDPGVVLYVAHRGGADILPPETMAAYTNAVNNKHGLEADVYLLMNSGSDTDEQRMALVHDSDLGVGGADLLQADGVTPVPSSTSITTVSIAQYGAMWVNHPTGGTDAHPARWRDLLLFAKVDTGAGYWPNHRLVLLESKASGSLTPIINSVTSQGMIHQVLGNSFDLGRCQSMAAAGLHVMWLTTSFASRSAAQVAADGIEWVGWLAGTSGFSSFLSDAHAAGLYVNVYSVQSASQRDTYTAQGVEMISTDRPDLVFPDVPDGTATGAFTWAGSASGKRVAGAAGNGGLSFVGVAAGSRTPKASGTGTFTWSGAAAGAHVSQGTATGTASWVGSAAGKRVAGGSITGTAAWTGAAAGYSLHQGSATGSFQWSGAAVGNTPGLDNKFGAATGSYVYSGAAAGARASRGTATGSYAYTGTAAGARVSSGTTSGSYAYTGAATGDAPSLGVPEGAAAGSYTWASTASGATVKRGAATGAFAYAGASSGQRAPIGTTAGVLAWVGAAVGAAPSELPSVPTPADRTLTLRRENRTLDNVADARVLTHSPRPRVLEVT